MRQSLLRGLIRSDAGIAIAMVMFLGMVVVMLTSVVALRSLRQAGNTAADAAWEQALHLAESGLDEGLVRVNEDPGYTTGEVMPNGFESPEAARAWVLAAADARPDAELAVGPEGEYVVVRPLNAAAVFSVGYVPSRSDDSRRARIVHARIGHSTVAGGWDARYAILSGDDLAMNGNPTVVSGQTVGIHANGFLDVRGSVFADGCLSASAGSRVIGTMSQDPGCGEPGTQAPVEIPVVDVRSFWRLSEYDLCPGGGVKAGPAHATLGHTVGTGPCTGATVRSDAGEIPFRGWSFRGCCDAKLEAKWRQVALVPYDGVYYVYRGSAEVASSPGSVIAPWRTTLLVEGVGSCPGITGGDITISGSPAMVPHSSAGNLLMAAGRDIYITGGPHLSGIVAAHEQIKNIGDPYGTDTALLAELDCDSVDDLIDETDIAGNMVIDNNGPIDSPFTGSRALSVVTGWGEL